MNDIQGHPADPPAEKRDLYRLLAVPAPGPFRRRGIVRLHGEILAQLLRLPAGQRIVGFRTDSVRSVIDVCVEGDGLPECWPGTEPMIVNTEQYAILSRWAMRGRDLEDQVRALINDPTIVDHAALASQLRALLDGDEART